MRFKPHIERAAGLLALMGWAALADEIIVDVAVETVVDGEVTRIAEADHAVGAVYACTAPAVGGAIFTHWTISTDQAFAARDVFGRAFDAVSAKIYEATVLQAHYVAADLDADGDGLADGVELYWYGSTDASPSSDTDGDGKTFAEELAAGTNPHLVETQGEGRLLSGMSPLNLYNPNGYRPYVIRSNPEGALFESAVVYLEPGSNVATAAFSPLTSSFAYWTVNGEVRRDALGRASDSVAFTTGEDLVIEAVCAENAEVRAKLYWYGREDVSMDGDTDGDGATFAEELAAGTNPLLAEEVRPGTVLRGTSAKNLYNPNHYSPCIIRSEPENRLFPTEVEYLPPGTNVVTPACTPGVGGFAYWTLDGVVRRDALGRAVDAVAFVMTEAGAEAVAVCGDGDEAAKLYWYGRTDVSMDSDTDGDGATFAEELAAGTNPLLAEEVRPGGVIRGKGANTRVDLQAFELSSGMVVDSRYRAVFKTASAAGESFGSEADRAVRPIVFDVTGDGLFDVIVVSAAGVRIFVNVGVPGDPQFEERSGLSLAGFDLGVNDVSRLQGLALDVPAPADALSCAFGDADQDGVDDLLVSDGQGRIWYYRGSQPLNLTTSQPLNFVLQHKVWGGTYAGFAEGLRIAAVDWDDDGDLDCLCGTAEGKLMLLVDPGAGRPTGLVADAGVDSVNLAWNASRQSRVRGYRVYRSDENVKGEGEGERRNAIGEAELPNYRDVPEREGAYAYRVTALSRNYVAGNSEPVVTESKPSEAVSVDFGTAQFRWRLAEEGGTVSAQLIVRNSSGLGGELQLRVGYNPAVLTPAGRPFRNAAIAPAFAPTVTKSGADALIVSGSLGAVVPDQGGVLFSLVFTKASGADLAAANLTVAEFTLETEGHGTKIELGETTDGGSGDVNLDGAVDEADVAALKAILKKTAAEVGERVFGNADVNGDGQLNALDVVMIGRMIKERK